jgi:error-prone DNA polymerase
VSPPPAYAELQVTSNFSFLRGASGAKELMVTAEALGISALGFCDRNTLAGVVRPWTARKTLELRVRPLTGCRLDFADDTPSLLCYPTDRAAYGRLTRLLTDGQRRCDKGGCELHLEDFLARAEGQAIIAVPPDRPDAAFEASLDRLGEAVNGNLWLAASRGFKHDDLRRIARLDAIARRTRVPLVATNDVLYHGAERRPLQDVMTCIREGCTIREAGFALEANAERHLKTPAEMARLFARWPEAVERTAEIVGKIGFDLKDISYEYPDEPVPPGSTAIGHLTKLACEGARWRYPPTLFPKGVPRKVIGNLFTELRLIRKQAYANYFLTVHDIVRWAREQDILCQGRGSAANSSVCYCLGVTAVDPAKYKLLFTRFISENRDEPPDIDVDFEHDRREEVMQYVYRRYGRHRAAIVATVIHYRPRSAIRDVGKALGLSEDITSALANTVWGSWGEAPSNQVVEAGLDPSNPEIIRAVELAGQLLTFPRHLSQHVGGYVLTQRRLDETVPIGNAAMPERTFIEWDKDDIDSLGLMKVDVLALGMLTALQRGLKMLAADHDVIISDIADIPEEIPSVYAMLTRAESIGVFQVESRAQMSMLPRLKPVKFYDLVIEVAIVRPGPIQGNMVHPYLKRRNNPALVHYPAPHPDHGPHDELKELLGDTLGVPLFQEQAMRLAIEAAKFSPADADGLRRSMATFRAHGMVAKYETMFVGGMISRGYEPDFAHACFEQIKGFGSYGFPESHAASFAKLVYASAWMKHVFPDVFCAALLNSQPMGFYQPAQLVRDAQNNGVEIRPVQVLESNYDCTLEPAARPRPREDWPPLKAMRLGLRQITGISKGDGDLIMKARDEHDARDPAAFARHGVSKRTLELLAEADAFASLGLTRREALWAVKGAAGEVKAPSQTPLLAGLDWDEQPARLPVMPEALEVAEDYRTTRLSLRKHPCEFFRPLLASKGATPAKDMGKRNGQRVAVVGLVLVRQRPGTAKGVVFMTIEDETGPANIVIWRDVFQANRRTVMTASLLLVHGRLQHADNVTHLVAERFEDLSARLADLKEEGPAPQIRSRVSGRLLRSRDFH